MKPFALVFATAIIAGAATISDTISGIVYHSQSNIPMNADSKVIKNAVVTLQTPDTTVFSTTDSLGKFMLIRDIPVGVTETRTVRPAVAFSIENSRLTFGTGEIAKVSVADIRGRILFSKTIAANQASVDLPNDASGYRLVSIVSRTGQTQTIPWISGTPVTRSQVDPVVTAKVVGDPVEIVNPWPDTMKVSAEGYPELSIAVNADSNRVPTKIVMIDSSRGLAKDIQVTAYYSYFNSPGLKVKEYGTVSSEMIYVFDFVELRRNQYNNGSCILGFIYSAPESFSSLRYLGWLNKDTDFVNIDLDSVPYLNNSIYGTVFQTRFRDYQFSGYTPYVEFFLEYHGNSKVYLINSDSVTILDSVVTDLFGRYQFTNVVDDSYFIRISEINTSDTVGDTVTSVSFNRADYKVQPQTNRRIDHVGNICFDTISLADTGDYTLAPNIYLYPESTSQISVNVNIRENGSIPFSIPTYRNGWNVTATPEGKINDSLGFLYYDFISKVPYQSDSGWVLSYANFDAEVTKLLSSRGLNKQEIWDFIDFWKKYIPSCDWVTLYPTDANKMVELTVNPKPVTLFRELYLVQPSTGVKPQIKEPSRGTPFVRKGFTVVEWGGHLDGLELDRVIADKQKK